VTRAALRTLFARWRQWDWVAAQRTNRYVANSLVTQARIRAYFRPRGGDRASARPHRPVRPGPVSDYYVVVSELMAHKQIDVAIAAFNALALPLLIVGDGPAARRLRAQAGPTVRFAGRISDGAVAEAIQGARAMIVTAVEEFGIAAVESMAAGRPVIARRGGGVLETVVEGVTGCFWAASRLTWRRRCSSSTTRRSIPRRACAKRPD